MHQPMLIALVKERSALFHINSVGDEESYSIELMKNNGDRCFITSIVRSGKEEINKMMVY